MIGKCFYHSAPDEYYTLVTETDGYTRYKGIVVFSRPMALDFYSRATSRIYRVSNWSVDGMREVPKEEFLKVYKEAVEEHLSIVEEVL